MHASINEEQQQLQQFAGNYTQTDNVIKRSTPILFSTNRGLHLRVAKTALLPVTTSSITTITTTKARTFNPSQQLSGSAYDIRFCDLERWSTNRANTVSLEDTFTISQPIHRSGLMSNVTSFQHSKGSSKNADSCAI